MSDGPTRIDLDGPDPDPGPMHGTHAEHGKTGPKPKLYLHGSELLTLREIAELEGISYAAAQGRCRTGMYVEPGREPARRRKLWLCEGCGEGCTARCDLPPVRCLIGTMDARWSAAQKKR